MPFSGICARAANLTRITKPIPAVILIASIYIWESTSLTELYSNCNSCSEVWFLQTERNLHPVYLPNINTKFVLTWKYNVGSKVSVLTAHLWFKVTYGIEKKSEIPIEAVSVMAAQFVVALITALMHDCRIALHLVRNQVCNVRRMSRRTRIPTRLEKINKKEYPQDGGCRKNGWRLTYSSRTWEKMTCPLHWISDMISIFHLITGSIHV